MAASAGGSGYDGLEVDEDLRFEQWESRVQRAGWLIMVAVVVAAVLGLFGNGVFSYVTNRSADRTLAVGFDRFLRIGAPAELEVEVGAVAGDTVELAVDRRYLGSVDIERVTPTPAEVRMRPDSVVYSFPAMTGGSPVVVTIRVVPDGIGLVQGVLRSAAAEATVRQFVYP